MPDTRTAFERATDLIAARLAEFRQEGANPTDNERLMAGHLVGALWANDLLNTATETWGRALLGIPDRRQHASGKAGKEMENDDER